MALKFLINNQVQQLLIAENFCHQPTAQFLLLPCANQRTNVTTFWCQPLKTFGYFFGQTKDNISAPTIYQPTGHCEL